MTAKQDSHTLLITLGVTMIFPTFRPVPWYSVTVKLLIQPLSFVFVLRGPTQKSSIYLNDMLAAVLYCDSTGNSNKSGNHQLLTFSGHTTQGQQFIFLKVWIHNQKQVTFKWVLFKAAVQSCSQGIHFK
jgi:hypothetical protein